MFIYNFGVCISMRKLLHLLCMHDVPSDLIDTGNDEDVSLVNDYHVQLNKFYVHVSKMLAAEHRVDPFCKVYMEGYTDVSEVVIDPDNSYSIPARMLVEQGAHLTVTEHNGVVLLWRALNDIVGNLEEANEYRSKIAQKSVSETVPILARIFASSYQGSQNHFANIFGEFFTDLEYADFNAARENWVGRNINSTLREGEKGILFFGRAHGTDRISSQLEKIVYSPIDMKLYRNP